MVFQFWDAWSVWIADEGEHAGLWDANPSAYEQTAANFRQAAR